MTPLARLLAALGPRGRGRAVWLALFGLATLVHVGTAAIRARSLLPRPQLMDFAAYYGAAYDLTRGRSPYRETAAARQRLQAEAHLPAPLPILHSPPGWAWLVTPLSALPYPVAALIWLAGLLALALWCGLALADLAGLQGWWSRGACVALVCTCGPVVLNFTLGQNGLFLLAGALALGQAMPAASTWRRRWVAAMAWAVAVAAKLFPVRWGAILGRRPQRRLAALLGLGLACAIGLPFACSPAVSRSYWTTFLPARARAAAVDSDLDDQAFVAWLERLTRAHTFEVPGLRVTTRHRVDYRPPWTVSPRIVRAVGWALVALVGAILLVVVHRTPAPWQAAALYLWVAFALLPVPHLERYNHVLLLPAMAWCWSQGPRGRRVAIGAYGLLALSRLNHLWAVVLPAPAAVIASGSGILATGVVVAGLAIRLSRLGRAAPKTGI